MQALAEAFPDAMSVWGPVTMDASVLHINAKDEHVVVSALASAADVLVTDDRRLREQIVLGPLSDVLDAQSPDVFLASRLDGDVERARQALIAMVRERWGMSSLADDEIGIRLSTWLERIGLTAAAEQLHRTR